MNTLPCILFIDFMLKGKILLDYTNFFSPNKYEKNDKIILKYSQYLKTIKVKVKEVYWIKGNKSINMEEYQINI